MERPIPKQLSTKECKIVEYDCDEWHDPGKTGKHRFRMMTMIYSKHGCWMTIMTYLQNGCCWIIIINIRQLDDQAKIIYEVMVVNKWDFVLLLFLINPWSEVMQKDQNQYWFNIDYVETCLLHEFLSNFISISVVSFRWPLPLKNINDRIRDKAVIKLWRTYFQQAQNQISSTGNARQVTFGN